MPLDDATFVCAAREAFPRLLDAYRALCYAIDKERTSSFDFDEWAEMARKAGVVR